MIKRQAGFTMAELLVTMAIFMFAIVAMSNVFVPLLTQFKQQSRVAETQIEGAVGLQILRKDIEQAGFGLPWVIPAIVTYSEAFDTTAALLNDSPNNPPRAIAGINNVSALGGSDYLVIKATSIATNESAMKWTHVIGPATASTVNVWGNSADDLNTSDLTIVLIPSRGGENQRVLVNSGTTFYAFFNSTTFPAVFAPSMQNDVYLIYGVAPASAGLTGLRMPFNRSDYFIAKTRKSGQNLVPARCAPNTGVLVKASVSQDDGDFDLPPEDGITDELPLLDCVADMQIIFRLDRDNDGTIDAVTDVLTDASGSALTAQEIREQLKEVRVYILAHEGQKDINYTRPDTESSVDVGEFGLGNVGDDAFDLTSITDWQRYRWKVYTIVVKPNNLRS